MKLSELIPELKKKLEENGDIEVICSTQDGGSYSPTGFECSA